VSGALAASALVLFGGVAAAPPPVARPPIVSGASPRPQQHGDWLPPVTPPAPAPVEAATPEPAPLDALLPLGVVLGGLGVAAVAAGAAVYVIGKDGGGEELCGLSGCFERQSPNLVILGGATLTAGAGLFAVAVPVVILGASGRGPRKNAVLEATGVVVAASGVAFLAGGLAAPLVEESTVQARVDPTNASPPATVIAVAGGLLTGLGVALWVMGGRCDGPSVTLRAGPGYAFVEGALP
jgi:hypothetical protein